LTCGRFCIIVSIMDAIVFDIETTSLDHDHSEIVEFCCGTFENGEWKEHHNSLYKPSEPISLEAMSVCHITNHMVESSKPFSDDKEKIAEILNQHKLKIAHYAKYDVSVLSAHGISLNNVVCTYRMAKKLFPDLESYKLTYLRYYFDLNVPEGIQFHRAYTDAMVTATLFQHLTDIAKQKNLFDTEEELIHWLELPVISETMTFGKYKGQKMVDVPIEYWSWALNNLHTLQEGSPDFDKDFAASVEKALENKL